MAIVKHQPTFEIRPSKAGDYLVIAIWPPRGLEQEIDPAFPTEAAARVWIERDASDWVFRNPHSR